MRILPDLPVLYEATGFFLPQIHAVFRHSQNNILSHNRESVSRIFYILVLGYTPHFPCTRDRFHNWQSARRTGIWPDIGYPQVYELLFLSTLSIFVFFGFNLSHKILWFFHPDWYFCSARWCSGSFPGMWYHFPLSLHISALLWLLYTGGFCGIAASDR